MNDGCLLADLPHVFPVLAESVYLRVCVHVGAHGKWKPASLANEQREKKEIYSVFFSSPAA